MAVFLRLLSFTAVTAVFIFTQAFIFQGFNGTDDLHYAWLAAKMLQGTYSPFRIDDIFSGRMLLVAYQALVYAAGGISAFTTQLGTYIALITACYLTTFHLMDARNSRMVITACSFFYFNPVLARITLSISPDVLILLSGILLVLLLKNLHVDTSKKKMAQSGIYCGLLIFCTLLIKESGFIFFPFLVVSTLLQPWKNRYWFLGGVISSFGMAVAACGLFYYHNTGDFLFRVHQIQHNSYPNPCNYHSFFQKEMLVRLTYGVWEEFILSNFYPVLLAVVAVISSVIFNRKIFKKQGGSNQLYFIVLLFLGLYFPFSLKGYEPLCFKARHFLFLLPLATVISTKFLEEDYTAAKTYWFRNIIAGVLLGICIKISLSGWFWNFYRCYIAWFILLHFFVSKRVIASSYLLLAAMMWLYMPYNFLFFKTSWYNNLKQLSKQLDGNYFYFPEHDNHMNWRLLKQFDTTVHIINFDQKPFKGFYPYYEPLHYHTGWFIVNKEYAVRSDTFMGKIDSLQRANYFSKTVFTKQVTAYYISRVEQFNYFKQLLVEEKYRICNCYD